jgi:hypothetical protein
MPHEIREIKSLLPPERVEPCLRGVELELEHGLGLAAVAATAPFEHFGSAAHSRERERHRLCKKDRIFPPLATPAEATPSHFHQGRHCNAGSES